jgi:hypothetical protein
MEAKNIIAARIKNELLENEDFYKSIDKARLPKEFFKEKFDEGISKISATSKAAIDKHFALTESDKEQFADDEKKDVTKYIAKAASLYKDKVKGGNKDLSSLQDENLSLKQALDERENQIKSLTEKFDSELTQKLTAKETETLALIEASGLQGNVPVAITLIWDKIYKSVNNKYSVIIESGVPQLRKKDNPAFKVDKADKSGHMTLRDAIVEEFKATGAWKEQQDDSKKNTVTVQVQPNKGVISDAIKKKIEEEERFFS